MFQITGSSFFFHIYAEKELVGKKSSHASFRNRRILIVPSFNFPTYLLNVNHNYRCAKQLPFASVSVVTLERAIVSPENFL